MEHGNVDQRAEQASLVPLDDSDEDVCFGPYTIKEAQRDALKGAPRKIKTRHSCIAKYEHLNAAPIQVNVEPCPDEHTHLKFVDMTGRCPSSPVAENRSNEEPQQPFSDFIQQLSDVINEPLSGFTSYATALEGVGSQNTTSAGECDKAEFQSSYHTAINSSGQIVDCSKSSHRCHTDHVGTSYETDKNDSAESENLFEDSIITISSESDNVLSGEDENLPVRDFTNTSESYFFKYSPVYASPDSTIHEEFNYKPIFSHTPARTSVHKNSLQRVSEYAESFEPIYTNKRLSEINCITPTSSKGYDDLLNVTSNQSETMPSFEQPNSKDCNNYSSASSSQSECNESASLAKVTLDNYTNSNAKSMLEPANFRDYDRYSSSSSSHSESNRSTSLAKVATDNYTNSNDKDVLEPAISRDYDRHSESNESTSCVKITTDSYTNTDPKPTFEARKSEHETHYLSTSSNYTETTEHFNLEAGRDEGGSDDLNNTLDMIDRLLALGETAGSEGKAQGVFSSQRIVSEECLFTGPITPKQLQPPKQIASASAGKLQCTGKLKSKLPHLLPRSPAVNKTPSEFKPPPKPTNRFKTPSKTINPALKNIVSPVGVYIKNTPKYCPLVKVPAGKSKIQITPGVPPEQKENIPCSSEECEFPPVIYTPSKYQLVTEAVDINLPVSIKKLVGGPVVSKHEQRIAASQHNQSIERRLMNSDYSINDSQFNQDVSIITEKQPFQLNKEKHE